jgi:hypothetical protein
MSLAVPNAVIAKLIAYMLNTDVKSFFIGDIEEISKELKEPVEHVKAAILVAYDTCNNYFKYEVVSTRNSEQILKMKIAERDWVRSIIVKEFENVSSLDIEHMEFIWNQFYGKINDHKAFEIIKFYYKLNTDAKFIEKGVKAISIKKTKDNTYYLDMIERYGYARKIGDNVVWKVYNTSPSYQTTRDYLIAYSSIVAPDESDFEIKREPVATGQLEIVDTDLIIEKVIAMEHNLNDIKKELGMDIQPETRALDKMDIWISKYNAMEDWEKLMKWNDLMKEWEGLKNEFSNN